MSRPGYRYEVPARFMIHSGENFLYYISAESKFKFIGIKKKGWFNPGR
jgi:hypothetical protein